MKGYCDFCDAYKPCECDDLDIDVCQGCGRYYSPHAGLNNWSRAMDGVAPQLCARCWRDQGYAWPERLGP